MNKKLKTLIIDGEPMALEKLRRYVEETDFLEIAGEFKDTAEALDYMAENAVDVIFTMIEFQRAVGKLKEAYGHKQAKDCAAVAPTSLFIRNEKEYERVLIKDILYIAGDAEYLAFHIAGRKMPLREKSSFAAVRRLLPDTFVQIHRSSVVNMDHVKQVGKMYVVMDDGTQIRISANHRDKFYSMVNCITVGK